MNNKEEEDEDTKDDDKQGSPTSMTTGNEVTASHFEYEKS